MFNIRCVMVVSGGRKMKKWILVFLTITAVLTGCFFLLNHWIPVVEIIGDPEITLEYTETFEDPGANVYWRSSLLPFITKEAELDTESDLSNDLGDHQIHYHIKNHQEADGVRVIHVVDTDRPVIHLETIEDHYTRYNHPYEEEGFSASDPHDGDLTDQVVSEEKDGYVYYTVSDSSGNTTKKRRKIFYDDREAPVITMDGGNEFSWQNGIPYEDHYSAEDDCDGDVTDKVIVEGNVDVHTNGDYTLTYTVEDSHGNASSAERIVHVKGFFENENTIYLTFDDGPGSHTDHLLDVLDQYNVKVTFFATNAYPGYAYCMKRAAEAGHTVAVHTASHNYAQIYASDEAYWDDFNRVNDVIEAQTGNRSRLFRFPGGSSNTVSANYSEGIMSRLAAEAAEYGYTYFDWNVSSGDAGGTTNTDTVVENVIRGVQYNHDHGVPSVVLQHDIKEFSVNAVESIILWGLENGYHFAPLSDLSFTAHHGIAN